MKRLYNRGIAALLVVALLVAGCGLYVYRYVNRGGEWASFPVNSHVYRNGVLTTGAVYDRDGEMLAAVLDGHRIFSDSYTLRRACLHVVGDAEGNIGTGLLSAKATTLMGYNAVNGAYSRDGSGNEIHTTIDADLCAAAYTAMAGRKGAVVLVDYTTGDVLCMVSTPGFDPANVPYIDEDDPYYDGAYINRAMSSTYTPGSVFKIVTLAAAIEQMDDLFTRTFTCEGSVTVDGEEVACAGVHGTVDIREAFAESCNCAFAQLSLELGADTLYFYAAQMGLLDSHTVSGIPAAAGSFQKAPAGSADLAWSGIGQYNDLMNPTAFARLMCAIADGGTAPALSLIEKVRTADGIPAMGADKGTKIRVMRESTANTLAELMRGAVSENYGDWRFDNLAVCAKSGTAEVGEGETPHAWFVGFSQEAEYPFAFAVIVENGGWGVSAAGEVAASVLRAAVAEAQ